MSRLCVAGAIVALQLGAAHDLEAQAREITGRVEVLWGMVPSLKGEPQFRYFVFDEGTRRNVEVRFDDRAVSHIGGAQLLNGKRVRVQLANEGSFGSGMDRVIDVRAVGPDLGGRFVPDLAARLDAVHPPSHTQFLVSGSRRYLTILCKYKDKAAEPGTKNDYEKLLGDAAMSVAGYWGEVSEQRINFDGSLVIGWLTMANDSAYYFPNGAKEANLNSLAADCTAAADPLVDFTQFHGVNTQYNGSLGCCGWGGGRTLTLDGQTKSYGFTWFPPHGTPPTGVGFVSHEVGHSLGLPHSGGPYGRTYDSKWDVMSAAHAFRDATTNRTFGAQTIGYHKLLLEWIPSSRRYVASAATNTVLVERNALPGANNPQIIVVPIRTTAEYYTIETRRRAGYDSQLPYEGVLIHHVKPAGRAEPAWVVDADGDGDPNDDGATWIPGETFVDARNQISITVDSLIGNAYKVTVRNRGGAASLALGSTGRSTTVNAGAAAVQDSVAVTITGAGSWTATKKNGRGSWLELVNASGSGSGQLLLRRNPTGLGVGTYVDTVLVSIAGLAPERYVDTLAVVDAGTAYLGLTLRSRHDSSLYYATYDSANVIVTGPGAGTTAWTATKKKSRTTLTIASGTGSGKVKWYRGFNQPAGITVDTITVTATGLPALTATIVDTFRVLEPVVLTRTERTRRDSMPEGAPPLLDSTVVTLSGRWATTGKLESWSYYWQRPGKFVRADPFQPNGYYSSRTGSGTVYWTRGPRALTPGTYVDTLTVCGPYCWYSAVPGHALYQYIVDTLTVYAAPLSLATSAASRRDSVALSLNMSKDSVQVLLTGTGAGAAKWSAASRTGKSILISDGAFQAPGTGTGSGWLRWSRNLAGRGAGMYVDTLVVSSSGLLANVVDTIKVLPAAALVLGRGSRRQTIVTGAQSIADSVDVTFLGAGGGSVAWTATARGAWTTLTTSSGTGAGKLRWTRNSSTFTTGQQYVDTITVSAASLYAGVAQLVDTAEAAAGAHIALGRGSGADSAAVNATRTMADSVQVTLAGSSGPTTAWSATKRGAWNTLNLSSGTGSGFLKWTRSSAGLALGTYVDTITVTATGASGSPARLIDTLRVIPSATIALSIRTRLDSAMAGSPAVLGDSAQVTMSGPSGSTTVWSATKRAAWTTLTTATGTGSGTLHWTRSAASLDSGLHVDTITVSADAAGAVPLTIIDTLRVRPASSVSLSIVSRNTPSLQGGSKSTRDSAWAVLQGYAASTSQWTATSSANWLMMTTSSGGTNARLRWSRNPSGLAAGTYVDTIRVSVAGSPAPAARIIDTLRVVSVDALAAARSVIWIGVLPAEMATLLDGEGNADGTLNLGDVLAHLDRTGTALSTEILAKLAGVDASEPDSGRPRKPDPKEKPR